MIPVPLTIRALAALALLAHAANVAGQAATTPDGWLPFQGSWSAVGTRQTLPTEGDRPAALIQVSGAFVLTSGEGLSRGFQGETIFFYDGKDLGVGRAVWTDQNGDRIFSTVKGEVVETGSRIVGTITGGTGRYAGIVGEYSFVWQFVVETEDEVIQGLVVALTGRARRGEVPQ